MRHRVYGRTLGRDKDHRRALLRNLSRALILEGSIKTTLAKAKFVRPYVEKLVTKAKKSNPHSLRLVRSKLPDEKAIRVLFEEIAPKFLSRAGGYTRIVKLGFRQGDNAPLARIEWVEGKKDEKNNDI